MFGQMQFFGVFISKNVTSPHLISYDFISADLISSELSGCEATQFAVATTNQKPVWKPTANPATTLATWRRQVGIQ